MRLVFISTMEGVPWGGSEELWSQVALRLEGEGHHVAASVYRWPNPAPRIAELKAQGVEVHERRGFVSSRAQRLWLRLTGETEQKWLRDAKPDLVIISQGNHMEGVDWMEFCRVEGLPFASIVQCNADIWWPPDTQRSAMARGYEAAQSIFCVSRHNLELLRRQVGLPLPQARAICNPYHVRNLPDRWPPSDPWRMACVARLEPSDKGQDVLLQVLSGSAWRERPVQIEFHGHGRSAQGLQDLSSQLGLKNVRFCGQTADIGSVWKQNHLLVLPSRVEGTPLALIEAMWCGRPAVVTDVGGNAECCADGQTGFVAPALTLGLLGDAMERAWARREEWQAMGKAARQRVQEILPKDPVELFCRELLGAASSRTQG